MVRASWAGRAEFPHSRSIAHQWNSARPPGGGEKPRSPRAITASRPPYRSSCSACRFFARASTSSGESRARSFRSHSLEPISKSPEEDNEASELYETEEVLGVVFPTDEDAALPLNPSKEALHEPASHIAA